MRSAVLRAVKKNGIDLVVVDTRPSVEADTVEIARLSDMVLIPTRPGTLDLRAIAPTTEVVRAVKLPKAATIIVLNGTSAARGFGENGLTAEARRALQAYHLPVADVSIGNWTAFARADRRPNRLQIRTARQSRQRTPQTVQPDGEDPMV